MINALVWSMYKDIMLNHKFSPKLSLKGTRLLYQMIVKTSACNNVQGTYGVNITHSKGNICSVSWVDVGGHTGLGSLPLACTSRLARSWGNVQSHSTRNNTSMAKSSKGTTWVLKWRYNTMKHN